MFHRVIVGVDANDGARDAIKLAKELASGGAQLVIAYVHDGYRVYANRPTSFELIQRDEADQLLNRLAAEFELTEMRAVGATSVGRGLHELVEREHADLLVVGSARDSAPDRVTVQNDLQSSLSGVPSAVAIAPAGYASSAHQLREIGIGFDGSSESLAALDVARQIAREHRASLSAFHALHLSPHWVYGGDRTYEQASEDFLADAKRVISELGGVEPHVTYGDAAEELTLYSASVDLLVVGSRSYGPIGRFVHGSTTSKLVHTCRCPLLALHRAQPTPLVSIASNTVITIPSNQPVALP